MVDCRVKGQQEFPGGGQLISPIARSAERNDASAGGGFGQAVAVALGDNHVCVMQEPVDGRSCEGLLHDFVES